MTSSFPSLVAQAKDQHMPGGAPSRRGDYAALDDAG